MADVEPKGPAALPPQVHRETTQISAANETARAFFGGRRPSWMLPSVSVPHTPPSPPNNENKPKKRRKMSDRKSTGSRASDKALVCDQETTSPVAAPAPRKQSNSLEAGQPAEEGCINVATVPSNIQTMKDNIHATTSTARGGDDSDIVPAASRNSPPQAGTTATTHVDQLDISSRSVSRKDCGTGVASPQDTGQSSVGSACGTSRPPSQPFSPVVDDASHDNLHPEQLLDQTPALREPSQKAGVGVQPPQMQEAATKNESSPIVISDLSQQHQPDNLRRNIVAELDRWRQIISERMKLVYRQADGGQAGFLQYARHRQLHSACYKNDAFYVILHQLFCIWSQNRAVIHTNIPMDPQLLDAAFWQLNVLLRPNTELAPENLQWFAKFPFEDDDAAARFPPYHQVCNDIMSFFVLLVQRLKSIIQNVQIRGYPILVEEMTGVLNCPSTQMQEVLFTMSSRHLCPNDQRLADPLNRLFLLDQQNSASIPAGGKAGAQQTDIRERIIARYQSLLGHSSAPSTPAFFQGGNRPHGPLANDTARLQQIAHDRVRPVNADINNNAAASPVTGHFVPLPPLQGAVTTAVPQIPSGNNMPSRHADPRSGVRQFISPQSQHTSPGFHQPQDSQSVEVGPNYSLASNPNIPARSSQFIGQAIPRVFHQQMPQNNGIAQVGPPALSNVPQPSVSSQVLRPQSTCLAGLRFTTSRITSTEHPHSPYDWTSVQNGLHLVRQRSPRREHAGVHHKRHYQFMSKLMTAPINVSSRPGIQTFKFLVADKDHVNRSRLVREDGIQTHHFEDGSLRYRLRFSKQGRDVLSIQETHWADCSTAWPEQVYILFNEEPVFPKRANHFHVDLPIEITEMVKKGENVVKTCFPRAFSNSSGSEVYFMAVETVVTMDHQSIVSLVSKSDRIGMHRTLTDLKHRLQPAELDDVIAQDDTLMVPITDPFSGSILRTPVRGRLCKHLECFDLDIWLQTRFGKPSGSGTEPAMADGWKCPICGLDARPCSLRIDEYFKKIVEDLKLNGKEQVKKIKISIDGSWVPVQECGEDDNLKQSQSPTRTSPTKELCREEIIEILDD